MRLSLILSAGLLFSFTDSSPVVHAQQKGPTGEWMHYGGDLASTKYSALDQINKSNVARLQVAWSWDSADKPLQADDRGLAPFGNQNTPLMVNGVVYATTALCQVAAINALTGETLWVFNPQSYKAGRPGNFGYVHRGIAYWRDGQTERIFLPAHDSKLWAIDAKTGIAASEFGDGGAVDLAKAIPLANSPRNYSCSSPPVVCRGMVIVGASIHDGPQTKEYPRGDVQAFDARTGKPAWIFHSVPQEGELGNDTWLNDAWEYTGSTNVWSMMSADEELGYAYLPFGTPTNDYYGGHRHGDGLFAESLVCVDVTTGRRVWHFQTVHHGLWDYDLPAAPVLCNLKVDGRDIRAVAQITKTGFTFVFDRATGKPVWPIEELPVKQTDVPGERTSPTQPFPTKPAPYERQGATVENLTDFTPEIHAEAKAVLEKFNYGPLFTPPTEKGTVTLPGAWGGANWAGASFDSETGYLYIPSVTVPNVLKMSKPDASRSSFDFVRGGASAPGPRGLPLMKPPYGRITAINLFTGDHVWMIPNGDGQRARYSETVGRDVGPVGGGGTGPLLTKTLLFTAQGKIGRGFVFGNNPRDVLKAIDKATGEVVAEIELPASPQSTPMTYMAGGKQHIIVGTHDHKLVALRLPDGL